MTDEIVVSFFTLESKDQSKEWSYIGALDLSRHERRRKKMMAFFESEGHSYLPLCAFVTTADFVDTSTGFLKQRSHRRSATPRGCSRMIMPQLIGVLGHQEHQGHASTHPSGRSWPPLMSSACPKPRPACAGCTSRRTLFSRNGNRSLCPSPTLPQPTKWIGCWQRSILVEGGCVKK